LKKQIGKFNLFVIFTTRFQNAVKMKKTFTSLSILIAASCGVFLLSSCTREFTCQCKMTYAGDPGLPEVTLREYSIKDTKKGAESKCKANSASYEKDGITTVEDCDLW